MIIFLKKILEAFKYFMLKLAKAVLSFTRLIAFSRPYFRNIGELKTDRQVVVVGNGPSFREQLKDHLDFFKSKDIFCVNNFPLTEEYKILKPVGCIWLDPAYFNKKHKNELREDLYKALETIVTDTTWEMTLYLPHFAHKRGYYKEINKRNPLVKVLFFNYTIFDSFDFINHPLYRSKWAMPRATTVVVAGLYIAITRKYQKVFVAGVETDFIKNIIVDKNNILFFEHKHFYTKERHLTKIQVPTAGFGKLNLGNYLNFIANIYKGYTELNSYAEHMKVPVINITPDSYIDAFEKKDIPEIS